jgi:hypothetical protein
MASLLIVLKNGESFVLGGEVAEIRTAYEALLVAKTPFAEFGLPLAPGARLAVATTDISAVLFDPAGAPDAVHLSPIIRMSQMLSGNAINQRILAEQPQNVPSTSVVDTSNPATADAREPNQRN